MFDMSLSNVKELKRLKNFENDSNIERFFFFIFNFDELIDVGELKFEILH